MIKISTRLRIVITTFLVGMVYFLTQNFNVSSIIGLEFSLNFDPAKHVLLGIITYIGTYWSLFYKIKGERYLTILLFPALGVMCGSFLTELIINYAFPDGFGQFTFQIIATILVSAFAYITILTVNILNAHYLNNIPLGQAAKASYFVLSLLIVFIVYFILLSNDIWELYKAIGFFLITFLSVYMCLWSIDFKINERFIIAITIAILITWGQILLIVWPINPTYLSLILNLFFYFMLNMAMEKRERLTKWIWIEYTSLYFLIITILLVMGEWGINSSIF